VFADYFCEGRVSSVWDVIKNLQLSVATRKSEHSVDLASSNRGWRQFLPAEPSLVDFYRARKL
jgi:hypothetical protein